MSKRPRAEEHANGGGGGRQEHQHHRGGGGGYGHAGRGRGGGRGGGGGKMPHLSAAAEEKRQGMRVQEMETLRKRVVEEAPAPGMSTFGPKILMPLLPSHTYLPHTLHCYKHRLPTLHRRRGQTQDLPIAASVQNHPQRPGAKQLHGDDRHPTRRRPSRLGRS